MCLLDAAVLAEHASTKLVLSECFIYRGEADGVVIRELASGLLSNCQIYDFKGDAALLVANKASPSVFGCVVRDNGGNGIVIDDHASGLFEDCQVSGSQKNNLVISCGACPDLVKCTFSEATECGVLARDAGLGSLEACEMHSCKGANFKVESRAEPVHMLRRCSDSAL